MVNIMRIITATELRNNLGKYIKLSQIEDIYITKNGKPYSKLTNALDNDIDDLLALGGIFENSDLTIDDTRIERLKK